MKVYIKVKEAIAHYNRVKKPKVKMTTKSLGEKVFSGDKTITSVYTMEQYLSGWNNGYTNSKKPSLHHAVKISIITGYSLNDLVYYDK